MINFNFFLQANMIKHKYIKIYINVKNNNYKIF